jgi:hypothetical protein
MSEFYTGLLILLFALVVIWFVAATCFTSTSPRSRSL